MNKLVYNGSNRFLSENVVWTTSNPETAVWFGDKVYHLEIRFEKPFVVNARGNSYLDIPRPNEMKDGVITKRVDTDTCANFAFKNGYDSCVIKNVYEGNGNTKKSDVIVVKKENIVRVIEEFDVCEERWGGGRFRKLCKKDNEMNKLNEQISRIRGMMGLNEAMVDSSGNVMGLEPNIFDEFPDDILNTLEDEYGYMYAHNFDWNSKSRVFKSADPNSAYDAIAFNKWIEKNKQAEFLKNLDKIISAVRSDLLLIKRTELAKKKLDAFEELIKPVFGKHITGDVLTKFEEEVLLDPNATIESIERGFAEAKNIIDQYGNIDSSKIEKSTIFTGGDINIPNFERFVAANPEYKKTYDVWSKLHDEYLNLFLAPKKAFRGYSYDSLRKLYDYLITYKKR